LSDVRVFHLIDSLRAEGAQRSLLELATGFADHGVQLAVGSLHGDGPLAQDLRHAGADVVIHAGSRSRVDMMRFASRVIRDWRPDLVHTTLFDSDVIGRVVARRSRVPVVSSLVNASYGAEHRDDPNVNPWMLRAAHLVDAATARLAVRLHAVSHEVAIVMARRLAYPRARIDVVPRGRDPERLGTRTAIGRRAARESIGASDDDIVVVAVARHAYQKGLDLLLDATAMLGEEFPTLRLLVAGEEGGETSELRARSSVLGLEPRVEFLGRRDDVAELLTASDVFAFPSRREGFPGAVLEAMALEAPIVASDLPQVREAVGDESAILVRPGSAPALSEGIAAALRDPESSRVRVQRARDRFLSRFTTAAMTEGMLAFYGRSLGRG
jgi:glycosyltransferase involved in cell wall biosynthesis